MKDNNKAQESERRQSRRIKKSLHVQCGPWNRLGMWTSVIVQDISDQGMRFIAEKDFLAKYKGSPEEIEAMHAFLMDAID